MDEGMETQKREVLNESYAGKKLEEVASALTAAGYKIRVIPDGVPVRLTENHDIGRASIYVSNGVVARIVIG